MKARNATAKKSVAKDGPGYAIEESGHRNAALDIRTSR
jgi:hypothetical protein